MANQLLGRARRTLTNLSNRNPNLNPNSSSNSNPNPNPSPISSSKPISNANSSSNPNSNPNCNPNVNPNPNSLIALSPYDINITCHNSSNNKNKNVNETHNSDGNHNNNSNDNSNDRGSNSRGNGNGNHNNKRSDSTNDSNTSYEAFPRTGWNWLETIDSSNDVNNNYNNHGADSGKEFQRPPSLCVLEDIIMAAAGSCCALGGHSNSQLSQTLLAAIDEGVELLREKYTMTR
jgi:hypothetical protein